MILGTRGSALALAQTKMVQAALRAAHPDLDLAHVVIHTTGDLRQDLRLGRPDSGSDKSVWTKELEGALADDRIHAAVHSAKDVPTELPPGFQLVACLPRAAVNDVLVARQPGGLEALPDRATVATSSVRRARQLRHHRPDLRVVEMRGNVPSRLQKLHDDLTLDGIVLARAGLDRLDYVTPWSCASTTQPTTEAQGLPRGLHATLLSTHDFLPAAAQGIVVLEAFGEDTTRDAILSAITHQPTWVALRAEREFLRLLHAGCHTPIGLLSTHESDQLHMQAIVFPDDEESPASPRTSRATGHASTPEIVAAQLFQDLS